MSNRNAMIAAMVITAMVIAAAGIDAVTITSMVVAAAPAVTAVAIIATAVTVTISHTDDRRWGDNPVTRRLIATCKRRKERQHNCA
jgi:hypothetical protein